MGGGKMSDSLGSVEKRVLLVLLDAPLTIDDLVAEVGADAPTIADELVRRGFAHRSGRGNYLVPSAARPRVLEILGDDAPKPEQVELEYAGPPHKGIWVFNGVGTVETYRLMLHDGLYGSRESDAATVSRMQPGDLLLIYITEPYSEWVCIQRVTSRPFRTTPLLHGHSDLPLRTPAEFVVALTPGDGLGRLEAADMAHVLGGSAAPHRHSPKRVNQVAARVIVSHLVETNRRKGSAVPVVDLGPGYEGLASL